MLKEFKEESLSIGISDDNWITMKFPNMDPGISVAPEDAILIGTQLIFLGMKVKMELTEDDQD